MNLGDRCEHSRAGALRAAWSRDGVSLRPRSLLQIESNGDDQSVALNSSTEPL
jgi:hypothetical protein